MRFELGRSIFYVFQLKTDCFYFVYKNVGWNRKSGPDTIKTAFFIQYIAKLFLN